MKLKKIASLMLAGIMAVSMLAACGEGKDNTNPPASSDSTTVTTLVSAFEDGIKDANKKLVVSVDENTALANGMKKYNEDFSKNPTSVNATDLIGIINNTFGSSSVTEHTDDLSIISAETILNKASLTGTSPDEYMYAIYAGKAGESAADVRKQAVNSVSANMGKLLNVFAGASNAQVRADYTMYVYEGSVVDASNKTVNYVMAVLKADYSQSV